MRAWDTHTDDGAVTGFEINNFLITRGHVARTLKRIPGVTITKHPKMWVWSDDDFIHFTLNGHKFLVIEPYGDNSRYWIVAEGEGGRPFIETIKRMFTNGRPFWRI